MPPMILAVPETNPVKDTPVKAPKIALVTPIVLATLEPPEVAAKAPRAAPAAPDILENIPAPALPVVLPIPIKLLPAPKIPPIILLPAYIPKAVLAASHFQSLASSALALGLRACIAPPIDPKAVAAIVAAGAINLIALKRTPREPNPPSSPLKNPPSSLDSFSSFLPNPKTVANKPRFFCASLTSLLCLDISSALPSRSPSPSLSL